MAREFDPRRLRPISLNIRPDDETQAIYCYDGQHRIAAAIYREGEDYCMNATLARVSYQEEARLFAEQHQNERQVGRLLKFNALIEAEDANALACRDLAEQLGLTLGHQAQTHMVAATTFVDCYQRWGADATEVGLRCVLNRWGGTATSLEQQIVKGFVFFVKRRSTHPNFVMSRFTDSLQRISLSTLEDKAGDHSKLPDYQGIAAALTDIYNYARRERLPEWNPRGEKA